MKILHFGRNYKSFLVDYYLLILHESVLGEDEGVLGPPWQVKRFVFWAGQPSFLRNYFFSFVVEIVYWSWYGHTVLQPADSM